MSKDTLFCRLGSISKSFSIVYLIELNVLCTKTQIKESRPCSFYIKGKSIQSFFLWFVPMKIFLRKKLWKYNMSLKVLSLFSFKSMLFNWPFSKMKKDWKKINKNYFNLFLFFFLVWQIQTFLLIAFIFATICIFWLKYRFWGAFFRISRLFSISNFFYLIYF